MVGYSIVMLVFGSVKILPWEYKVLLGKFGWTCVHVMEKILTWRMTALRWLWFQDVLSSKSKDQIHLSGQVTWYHAPNHLNVALLGSWKYFWKITPRCSTSVRRPEDELSRMDFCTEGQTFFSFGHAYCHQNWWSSQMGDPVTDPDHWRSFSRWTS